MRINNEHFLRLFFVGTSDTEIRKPRDDGIEANHARYANNPKYSQCPRCGFYLRNLNASHYADPYNLTPCIVFAECETIE